MRWTLNDRAGNPVYFADEFNNVMSVDYFVIRYIHGRVSTSKRRG